MAGVIVLVDKCRIATVVLAEAIPQSVVRCVSEQATHAIVVAPRKVHGNIQVLVNFLTQPPQGVNIDKPDARFIAAVLAGAMSG